MRHRLAAVFCLLLFWWLALHSARTNSPITDEPMHLMRGVTLWQTGDFRFQFEHAPLSHWLIGLLLPTEPTLPDVTTLPGWVENDRHQVANALLWDEEVAAIVPRLFFLGRLPIVWAALLIGCVTAVFARRRSGRLAASVVLLLFALSPNFLASATVGTTDLLSVAGFVLTVWALWEFERDQRWGWLGLAGVGVGVAMGTKLTGGLIVPLSLLLLLSGRSSVSSSQYSVFGGEWLRPFLYWVAMGPIAFLVLWGIYGFEFRPPAGWSFPLPAATYAENFLSVSSHISSGHATFLLGERSTEGWYHYFLVAFGVKTPLPVLLLLLGSLVWMGWQRRVSRTVHLWLPPLAVLLAASLARLNIGYRHILPMLPFVWLLIAEFSVFSFQYLVGGHPNTEYRIPNIARLAVWGLLLGWLALGTLRVQPHHLSYFNELVGVENGYRVLSDSNVDWGQDFYRLADFLETAAFPVQAGYLGVLQPALGDEAWQVDRETETLPNFAPANPAGGWYAISASYVQGMHVAEPDLFYPFWEREPDGRLGHSILLYELPPAVDGGFVGHCAAPAPLLSPQEAEEAVGQSGLRHFNFDCTTSWVLAENGRSGWYVVPQGVSLAWLDARVAEGLTRVYRHAATTRQPAYHVYYWAAEEARSLLQHEGEGWPIRFGETAVLLAYQQSEMEWMTAWQATMDAPPQLSVQAHLLFEEDGPPLVADGLGFASEQWRTGDVIIQRHRFEQAGASLQTGLYNYVTGEAVSPTPLRLPR